MEEGNASRTESSLLNDEILSMATNIFLLNNIVHIQWKELRGQVSVIHQCYNELVKAKQSCFCCIDELEGLQNLIHSTLNPLKTGDHSSHPCFQKDPKNSKKDNIETDGAKEEKREEIWSTLEQGKKSDRVGRIKTDHRHFLQLYTFSWSQGDALIQNEIIDNYLEKSRSSPYGKEKEGQVQDKDLEENNQDRNQLKRTFDSHYSIQNDMNLLTGHSNEFLKQIGTGNGEERGKNDLNDPNERLILLSSGEWDLNGEFLFIKNQLNATCNDNSPSSKENESLLIPISHDTNRSHYSEKTIYNDLEKEISLNDASVDDNWSEKSTLKKKQLSGSIIHSSELTSIQKKRIKSNLTKIIFKALEKRIQRELLIHSYIPIGDYSFIPRYRCTEDSALDGNFAANNQAGLMAIKFHFFLSNHHDNKIRIFFHIVITRTVLYSLPHVNDIYPSYDSISNRMKVSNQDAHPKTPILVMIAPSGLIGVLVNPFEINAVNIDFNQNKVILDQWKEMYNIHDVFLITVKIDNVTYQFPRCCVFLLFPYQYLHALSDSTMDEDKKFNMEKTDQSNFQNITSSDEEDDEDEDEDDDDDGDNMSFVDQPVHDDFYPDRLFQNIESSKKSNVLVNPSIFNSVRSDLSHILNWNPFQYYQQLMHQEFGWNMHQVVKGQWKNDYIDNAMPSNSSLYIFKNIYSWIDEIQKKKIIETDISNDQDQSMGLFRKKIQKSIEKSTNNSIDGMESNLNSNHQKNHSKISESSPVKNEDNESGLIEGEGEGEGGSILQEQSLQQSDLPVFDSSLCPFPVSKDNNFNLKSFYNNSFSDPNLSIEILSIKEVDDVTSELQDEDLSDWLGFHIKKTPEELPESNPSSVSSFDTKKLFNDFSDKKEFQTTKWDQKSGIGMGYDLLGNPIQEESSLNQMLLTTLDDSKKCQTNGKYDNVSSIYQKNHSTTLESSNDAIEKNENQVEITKSQNQIDDLGHISMLNYSNYSDIHSNRVAHHGRLFNSSFNEVNPSKIGKHLSETSSNLSQSVFSNDLLIHQDQNVLDHGHNLNNNESEDLCAQASMEEYFSSMSSDSSSDISLSTELESFDKMIWINKPPPKFLNNTNYICPERYLSEKTITNQQAIYQSKIETSYKKQKVDINGKNELLFTDIQSSPLENLHLESIEKDKLSSIKLGIPLVDQGERKEDQNLVREKDVHFSREKNWTYRSSIPMKVNLDKNSNIDSQYLPYYFDYVDYGEIKASNIRNAYQHFVRKNPSSMTNQETHWPLNDPLEPKLKCNTWMNSKLINHNQYSKDEKKMKKDELEEGKERSLKDLKWMIKKNSSPTHPNLFSTYDIATASLHWIMDTELRNSSKMSQRMELYNYFQQSSSTLVSNFFSILFNNEVWMFQTLDNIIQTRSPTPSKSQRNKNKNSPNQMNGNSTSSHSIEPSLLEILIQEASCIHSILIGLGDGDYGFYQSSNHILHAYQDLDYCRASVILDPLEKTASNYEPTSYGNKIEKNEFSPTQKSIPSIGSLHSISSALGSNSTSISSISPDLSLTNAVWSSATRNKDGSFTLEDWIMSRSISTSTNFPSDFNIELVLQEQSNSNINKSSSKTSSYHQLATSAASTLFGPRSKWAGSIESSGSHFNYPRWPISTSNRMTEMQFILKILGSKLMNSTFGKVAQVQGPLPVAQFQSTSAMTVQKNHPSNSFQSIELEDKKTLFDRSNNNDQNSVHSEDYKIVKWKENQKNSPEKSETSQDQSYDFKKCEVETLPTPSFVVTHGKVWLEIPPAALYLWEKLNLEPYSPPKDISYYVIAPRCLSQQVQTFFKQLSAIYEQCNLGHHIEALIDDYHQDPNQLIQIINSSSIDTFPTSTSTTTQQNYSIYDDSSQENTNNNDRWGRFYTVKIDPIVLESYKESAKKIGKFLNKERMRTINASYGQSIVIYIVNPYKIESIIPPPTIEPISRDGIVSLYTNHLVSQILDQPNHLDHGLSQTTIQTSQMSPNARRGKSEHTHPHDNYGQKMPKPDDSAQGMILAQQSSTRLLQSCLAEIRKASKGGTHNIITHSISLTTITSPINRISQYKEIAFNIFTRCRRVSISSQWYSAKNSSTLQSTLANSSSNALEASNKTKLYEPLFVISSRRHEPIHECQPKLESFQNELRNASCSTFPETIMTGREGMPNTILKSSVDEPRNYTLHVSYTLTSNFLIYCLTDGLGELLESGALATMSNITIPFYRLWSIVFKLLPRTSHRWRVIFGKLGELCNEEIKEWVDIVNSTSLEDRQRSKISKVALVSFSMTSDLYVLQNHFPSLFNLKEGGGGGSIRERNHSNQNEGGGFNPGNQSNIGSGQSTSSYIHHHQQPQGTSSLNVERQYLSAMFGIGEMGSNKTAALTPKTVAIYQYEPCFIHHQAEGEIIAQSFLFQSNPNWEHSTLFGRECESAQSISLHQIFDWDPSTSIQDETDISMNESGQDPDQSSGQNSHHQMMAARRIMIRDVTKHFYQLSWLNMTPSSPRRIDTLPLHFRIVKRLSTLIQQTVGEHSPSMLSP